MVENATSSSSFRIQNTALPLGTLISAPALTPKPIPEEVVTRIRNRALGQDKPDSFGSCVNIQANGHESLLPALVKSIASTEENPTVRIGSWQCQQPYNASYFNASALSFGPLGKRFILALNRAAYQSGFFQNTGEAGLSPYHLGLDVDVESPEFDFEDLLDSLTPAQLENTGDVVLQLGNGYFGCRKPDGSFDPISFQKKSRLKPVKMIEIKLSQGVEPAARMPVKEVTRGMAHLMGIETGEQAKLKCGHSSFSTPVELLKFVQTLRQLSGGKPVGIKIGGGHQHYLFSICKAMMKTGILLDFITIDGMEAGTTVASAGTLGFIGIPLSDAVLFVHNALTGCNLRAPIKIIASGQVFTEQQMVCLLARGADLFATARGMMLAVGCDQQLECHKGICGRGIATQDPALLGKFNIELNAQRLSRFHQCTIDGLKGLVASAGLTHPGELRPFHIQKRLNEVELHALDEVYEFIKPGVLTSYWAWLLGQFPRRYAKAWRMASPTGSFQAPK